MEWVTKPGEDWDRRFFEGESGSWLILGHPAADYVLVPEGIEGYAAGTKLYIEAQFRVSFKCPLCGDESEKRGLAFKDSALVVLECLGCQRFIWCEIDRR